MDLQELKTNLSQIDLSKYNGMEFMNGTIIDARRFVDSHISMLEANPKNATFIPYYDRLFEFYQNINK